VFCQDKLACLLVSRVGVCSGGYARVPALTARVLRAVKNHVRYSAISRREGRVRSLGRVRAERGRDVWEDYGGL